MMKVWYIVVNIDGLIKQNPNPNPSIGQWMSSFEASGKAFLGWKVKKDLASNSVTF